MKITEKNKGFFKDVYEVVNMIPTGRVCSYGAIAKYLGSAKSARMVGWAMNASHLNVDMIPAHRVVNRNGVLSGKLHFVDPQEMQARLEKEGLIISNDKIENFEKYFWDPSKELSF